MSSAAAAAAASSKQKSFRELKAEKVNRLENWRLQMRLRLMDRELGHREYLRKVEVKQVQRDMESMRRTTGHSPLSVRPRQNDRALKDSSYFAAGQRISERALCRWRVQEAKLQRQMGRTDIEQLKLKEQQATLVRLLVDLGVIDDSAIVDDGQQQQQQLEQQQQQQQQQLVARAARMKQRPFTAIGQQQQQQQQQPPQPKRAASAAAEIRSSATSTAAAALPMLKQQRPGTAAPPKRSVTFSIDRPASQSKSKQRSERDEAEVQETEEEEEEVVVEQQAQKLPQWKRQLQYEAPPGLNSSLQPARVRLAVSKSALRKQLQEMVEANETDPQRLAEAAARRRQEQRQSMRQTMQQMASMSIVPNEAVLNRRKSMPSMLLLDHNSDSDDGDCDGDNAA